MKQRDLVKKLEKAGFELARHDSDHDIYKRGSDEESVPRHRENSVNRKKRLINEKCLSCNFYTAE